MVAELRAGLPDGVLIDDPDRMESYRFDKALFCPAGHPAAVVLAHERADVEHTLRTASGLGVPVVPQGAARIRVQVSAVHSREDLAFAIEKFAEVKQEFGL